MAIKNKAKEFLASAKKSKNSSTSSTKAPASKNTSARSTVEERRAAGRKALWEQTRKEQEEKKRGQIKPLSLSLPEQRNLSPTASGKLFNISYDAQFIPDYFENSDYYKSLIGVPYESMTTRQKGEHLDMFWRFQAGANHMRENGLTDEYPDSDAIFGMNDSVNRNISDKYLKDFLSEATEEDVRWLLGDLDSKYSDASKYGNSNYSRYLGDGLNTIRDYARNHYSSFANEEIDRIGGELAKLNVQMKNARAPYDAELLSEANDALGWMETNDPISVVANSPRLREAVGFAELEQQYSNDEMAFTDELRRRVAELAETEATRQGMNADASSEYQPKYDALMREMNDAVALRDGLLQTENYNRMMGENWVGSAAGRFNPEDYRPYDTREVLANEYGDTETLHHYNAPTLAQIAEDPEAVKKAYDQAIAMGADPSKNEDILQIQQMTDEELRLYQALYAIHGEEEAQRFYDHLAPELADRVTAAYVADRTAFAEEHPIIASLVSVPEKAIGGLAGTADMIAGRDGKNQFSAISQAERETVAQNIADATPWANVNGTNLVSAAYQGAMSFMDSMFNRALTAGTGSAIAGDVLLGMGSASDAYANAYEAADGDWGKAVIAGIASGLLEAGSEHISWGKLSNPGDLGVPGSVWKYIASASATEGLEEVVSGLGGSAIESLVLGQDGEIPSGYKYYTQNGYTSTEAIGRIAKELGWETTLEFLIGALMGGTAAGVNTAVQMPVINAENRQIGETLSEYGEDDSSIMRGFLDLAGTLDLSRGSRKIYEELNGQYARNESLAGKNAQARANAADVVAEDIRASERDMEAPQAVEEAQVAEQAASEDSEENPAFGLVALESVATTVSAAGRDGSVVREMYNEGQNMAEYATQFALAMECGKEGVDLDTALENSMLSGLTREQIVTAYAIGRDSGGRLNDASARQYYTDRSGKLADIYGHLTTMTTPGQSMAERMLNHAASAAGKDGDVVLSMYNEGQDMAKYATQIENAMRFGREGRDLSEVRANGALSELTQVQIATAYGIGMESASADGANARAELVEGKNAQARANAEQRRAADAAEELTAENAKGEMAGVKTAQAQANAEQRRRAEIAEELDSDSAREELAEEKNAQAQENAKQQKNAKVAKELSTENARAELAPGKGKAAVNKAKVGRLYREVMHKLEGNAQKTLRERMSFDVAKELVSAGVDKNKAYNLAMSILRVQDGSATRKDLEAVNGNSTARDVLLAYTAKVKAADEAAGKVDELRGLLAGKPPIKKAAPVTSDAPEQESADAEELEPLDGEDEFDAVVAEVQAQEVQESEGETSTLDGEEVQILGIDTKATGDKTADPMLQIKMQDGTVKTVAASSIAYGSNDASAPALAMFASKYGRQGDMMYSAYQPGQDVTEYARAFHKASQAGSDGRNLDVLKGSETVLNDKQLGIAYELGRSQRAARGRDQQMARSAKGTAVPVGRVYTSSIRTEALKPHQKISIDAMEKLAGALGINVRFVQSYANEQGRYTDDNGSWNADTRTLTLDINAGKLRSSSARNLMMDTAGHELTHYIRQLADSALWDEYQDFVMSHLDTKLNLEHEIKRYMANDKSLSRDDAIEEVIAQASVKALSKITDQQLADLAESNPSLFSKIKKFLDKWIKGLKKAIREAFSSGEGESNYIARAMEEQLDELAAKWNAMLVNASKNANASRSAVPGAQDVVDDFVKQYKEKPDVKHSKRSSDAEYQAAYEAGDEYRAREMVREAAIAAGYNPLKLYHGTTSFGFTKIDPSKSDDGISFFATADDMVAQTYVGENARIRRVNATGGITVDRLMDADGKTILDLLHKNFDEPYELASKAEIWELVGDEGELIRKRIIPEVERRLAGLREEHGDFPLDAKKEAAIEKAYETLIDTLDRMSYARNYEQLGNLYRAYDDALWMLRSIDESEASLYSYTFGNDIHDRYNRMQTYLNGDLFKVEEEWSIEYLTRAQAIDMLYPKLFKGIYELYGKTDNLLEIDGKGANWNRLDGGFLLGKTYATTRDFAEYAKEMGFDGVHFHDIHDVGGMANYNAASDVYTFFNPSDLKSADPFTFDDNGDLIPLSERFNRADEDIRYSVRETTDGHKVVAVEDDILEGIYSGGKWTKAQKDQAKKAAEKALETAGPIYSGGIPIYINSKTRDEFPSSEYVYKTLSKEKQKLGDRYRISSEAEDMLIATVGWKDDPLKKDRKDFVRFLEGRVYMLIHGRKYKATVKVGVRPGGRHVLYDLVGMNEASFEMKEEGISSATQANNAAVPYSEMPSTEGIITQNSEDRKRQMRDPYNASDRELLADALESLAANADELDILRRYQKRVQNLDAKQQQLQDMEERVYALKQSDAKANRDEIIKLTNNVKTIASQIDRMDKELLKLEVMAPIKKLADREREAYKQKLKAKTDEQIRRYKERVKMDTQDKIREIRERAKERADERVRKAVKEQREIDQRKVDRLKESHGKEKYRAAIMADVKKLYSWVVSPTNKGHVPQFLREPLGKFLESIDFSSASLLKGKDATKNDRKFMDALEKLRYAISDLSKQQGDIEGGANTFAGYIDLPSDYMAEFDELVRKIKTTLEIGDGMTDTAFNRMTADQLHEMSKLFRILNSSITKMNRLVANGRYESARTASNDTITDMNAMNAKVKTNKVLSTLNSMFNWKNTTPYYAFQRLGRGGKAIFEGLQDGWDKMARNSAELIAYAKEAFTAKQAKAWSKDIQTIELDSGESVQMTVSQIMSLYCLSKREQAVGHLKGGGIRVSDIDAGKGNTISQVDNYILSEADIDRITGKLTAEQKDVADKLQKFMNTTCSDWGNEISMKRFGYEMFTEKNYFPIETDANNRSRIDDKQDGNSSMFRLLNMSAMKELTPNANNAIIVRDIFDVFSNHASDIGKYNALALPILDFIKWYNFVERADVVDEHGKPTGQITTRSTQKALERAYGSDAKSYLMSFIKDLNAEHDGGRNDTVLSKLMGTAKAGSVNANIRVGFLQITSLPRAAYAINTKYLLGGMAKLKNLNPVNAVRGTAAQEDIGILKWKSLGFYSTDVARSTRGLVRRDDSAITKVRDFLMKPAEWGDNWVSNIIYEAVKLEMKDKHPTINPGSKAYEEMLNKRVREIVYKTQVVDSTMTRSDFMRSKGLMTAFTAFMSEPTLTVNMLNESIQEAVMNSRAGMSKSENLKSVGGKAVRAAATFAFTALASALVESIFDAMRDDDDYEELEEKFAAAFTGNVVDNVNVLGMLPILKDLVSIAQGYENNSMVTQAATQIMDMKKAIEAVQKGDRPVYSAIYNALKVVASTTGVGVQNATRDGVALYNTFLADAWGMPRVQTYENSKSEAAKAYYAAMKAGDTEKAEWILERAEVNGLTEEELSGNFSSIVRNEFNAGNVDAATAERYLIDMAGKDADAAYWQVREWEYTGADEFSKYGSLKTSVASGDRNAATAAYRELVEHGTKEESVAEQLSKLYNSGEATSLLNLQMRSNQLYTSTLKLKADGQAHKDDFDAFITAIVNGSGVASEIRKLKDKGYTTKQIMSAINGAFGKTTDRYGIMQKYNSREAAILLERILDAYEALGLNRKEELAWINENWAME